MTATLPTATQSVVPPVALTDGELAFYRKQGYLQIPGVLPADATRALHDEVMGIMHTIGGFEGSKLKQTPEHLAGGTIERFINDPNLCGIAAQLMGGPSSLYLPFTAVKGSGGGVFHFHQDNNYTQYADGMLGINLWFALVDMTPENGCLMIAPGSHTAGQAESENAGDGDAHQKVKVDPKEFLPIRMRAGDCVAFSRLTIHGSGPNAKPDPRVGYAVQFFRNNAHFLDRGTGKLKSLASDSPQKMHTKPVAAITVPKGKIDGH